MNNQPQGFLPGNNQSQQTGNVPPGNNQSQQTGNVPREPELQGVQTPSAEAEDTANFFREVERNQLSFLNEAGKSLVERISTFLAILLGASVLSNTFPPTYLKGSLPDRILIFLTLGCYVLAMGIVLWTIRPRWYRFPAYNVSALIKLRDTMIRRKMLALRMAGTLFFLGSLALAALIVTIVWQITQ